MAWNISVGRSAAAAIILLAVTAPVLITVFHDGEGRQSMAVAETTSGIRAPIPPIDAEAHAVIETATFALG